jgi:hypothetical protein
MSEAAPTRAIEREVALTEQDLIDANLLHARRFAASGGYRKLLILSFCAILVLGLADGHWSWRGTALLIGFDLLFIAVVAVGLRIANEMLIPRQARKTHREMAAVRGAYAVVVTPEGISFSRPDNYSKAAWSDFVKWTEDERTLIIFNSSRIFNTLPKHDFEPDEIAQIRAWIEGAGVAKY